MAGKKVLKKGQSFKIAHPKERFLKKGPENGDLRPSSPINVDIEPKIERKFSLESRALSLFVVTFDEKITYVKKNPISLQRIHPTWYQTSTPKMKNLF